MNDTTNIADTIKQRMEVVGWTQAKLAREIETTQNQLSLFLQGKSSLNITALNKCFDKLGVPLTGIGKRIELAKLAAKRLSSYSIEEISGMSRKEMIEKTSLESLRALPVVSKQEFEMMMESGVGDYEATFQYFKTLVLHFGQVSSSLTPKTVENSLSVLSKSLLALPLISFFGIGSAIMAGAMALASKNSLFTKAVDNAWGTLTTLTDSIFEKENKNKQ
ncbi:MAG: helix-turn-helix domain-containing protein [Muribaculaceae bacterium]|nr:helix-turn-helix domain-containing protein [Muribaculaceae bacterium]